MGIYKIKFRLSSRLRKELSRPLGKVFSGDELLHFISNKLKKNDFKIIAIGDETGRFLYENKIIPSIWIYDGKVRRKKIKHRIPFPDYIVKNPRSVITEDLCAAIDDALDTKNKKKKLKIFVKGEEDLAALYAIYKAKNSLILYGQPNKGIVAIITNNRIRKRVKMILEKMRISSFSFR
ncbi:MAG: DUF359 domain-containing protein [Candidatus Micrarchaeia archaeon]